jgi:uncharacterized membrane protein YfcA
MLAPTTWALVVGSGLLCGVINALAGGGSFLVLAVLITGGLDPGLANGTIRVGILAQNISGTLGFALEKKLRWKAALTFFPAITVGAVFGSLVATRIASTHLRPIFGGAFLVWSVLLVLFPSGFKERDEPPRPANLLAQLIIVAIGVYGGFMQAGTGLPLMGVLVPYLRHSPIEANGIKLAMVLGYTIVTLPLFAAAGQVHWLAGAALAAATTVGAWVGVKLQLRIGAKLVRRALIAMVALSGVLMVVKSL